MLTVKQVAAKCGVSPSLVYSWAETGVLPHYRAGKKVCRGRILVDEAELEAFVARMKAAPPPPAEQPALRHVKLKARHG